MAKIESGMMVGARKKCAGIVYRKGRDGSTIACKYTIPSNPQTAGQMAQRIIFATVQQALKLMSPVVNHSFEGVSYRSRSKNRFSSVNIDRLRQLAAQDFADQPTPANANVFVTTKNISALIPNEYIIADGSLSKPRFKGVLNAGVPNISFGGGSVECVANTDEQVGGYCITLGQAILAIFGLHDSTEQLTLCAIVRNEDGYVYSYQGSETVGAQIAPTAFNAKRLVFDPTADLSQQILVLNDDGTVNDDSAANIGAAINAAFNNELSDVVLRQWVEEQLTSQLTLSVDGDAQSGYTLSWSTFNANPANLYVYDSENDKTYVYALGVIRSKLDGSIWRRSRRTIMVCRKPAAGALANFGLTWNLANAAWFDKVQLTNDGYFLNESGTANEVGENF